VKANGGVAGVDHQTVRKFEEDLERNVESLSGLLRAGTYRPQAVRRVWIPKAGSREKRPLGIPTVRDRVAQAAVRHVLEPIFEREFAEQSCGFRPERGCKDALRRVTHLLKAGYTYVVDADLKSYFDSIPHERLMERIREKIADGRVLELIELFLEQKVMDAMGSWTPGRGTPQGAVLSPLLANIYLDPLDHLMKEKGFEMVRYADDCAPRAHFWIDGSAVLHER
jgi:RNA-directed DNA polymerase